MIKAIIRFLGWLPLSLLATLISYPLAPLVVLLARPDGFLPHSLRIFQTPDNSLDGDYGWKTEHRWFKKSPKVDEGWRRWVNRFRWLWRNSAHGFKREYLGFVPKEGFVCSVKGDQATSNRPLHNGAVLRWVVNPDGKAGFQFYFVRAWSKNRCLRINMGWKLWQNPKIGEYAQHVCSINPLMGWSD